MGGMVRVPPVGIGFGSCHSAGGALIVADGRATVGFCLPRRSRRCLAGIGPTDLVVHSLTGMFPLVGPSAHLYVRCWLGAVRPWRCGREQWERQPGAACSMRADAVSEAGVPGVPLTPGALVNPRGCGG
jgi:hypothetical protein